MSIGSKQVFLTLHIPEEAVSCQMPAWMVGQGRGRGGNGKGGGRHLTANSFWRDMWSKKNMFWPNQHSLKGSVIYFTSHLVLFMYNPTPIFVTHVIRFDATACGTCKRGWEREKTAHWLADWRNDSFRDCKTASGTLLVILLQCKTRS